MGIIIHHSIWEHQEDYMLMMEDGSGFLRMTWEEEYPYWFLSNLHVDEDKRHQGIATQLLDAAQGMFPKETYQCICHEPELVPWYKSRNIIIENEE